MTGVNGGKWVLLLVFGVLQHIDAQPFPPASMVCQRNAQTGVVRTYITVVASVFTSCDIIDYNIITSTTQTPTYTSITNCIPNAVKTSTRYSFTETATSAACVSRDGPLLRVALHCFADDIANTVLDVLYLFSCDTRIQGHVIPGQVNTSTQVGNPPTVAISRQYSVSLTAKLDSNLFSDPPNPTSLGTLIRLVVPFDIKNKASFDTNGPKGVFLSNCIISQPGVSSITLTDSNGCILPPNPNVPFIPNGSGRGQYLTSYQPNLPVIGALAGQINNDRNVPLNVFITLSISARSIRRGNRANVALTCSCNVGICLTTTDLRCFGSPGPSNPTTCTPVQGRKRRDTASFYANSTVAETVQATLVIKTDIDTTSAANTGDCFDKTTFVALTAVLGVLLLIVLVIAVFLFCHLMKTSSRTSSHDDRSSASTASGIMNKGFY